MPFSIESLTLSEFQTNLYVFKWKHRDTNSNWPNNFNCDSSIVASFSLFCCHPAYFSLISQCLWPGTHFWLGPTPLSTQAIVSRLSISRRPFQEGRDKITPSFSSLLARCTRTKGCNYHCQWLICRILSGEDDRSVLAVSLPKTLQQFTSLEQRFSMTILYCFYHKKMEISNYSFSQTGES